MDPNRKARLFKKIRGFAKIAGKMNSVSTEAAQKRQQEEENKNILNTAIEKGIAYEKFVNAVQRKVKTEADAKLILSNIQDYEAVNKLFGKDTEQIAKLTAQPIIKQNEASNNKFYIIAKGSVAILKATDTNVFQVVAPKKEEPQDKKNIDDGDQEDEVIGDANGQVSSGKKRGSKDRRQTSLGSLKRGSQLFSQDHKRNSKAVVLDPKEAEKQLWIQETEKYGKEVNQLYVGQGFGEAAIMEADPKRAKRGATILAREDETTLLIIVKRDFQKFKDSFSSQGKEKAAILSQLIPQLKLINSTQTKNDLIFYFQEEGGLRGQALTVEDKTGDKIFVLKEGQVQIEKNYINTKNIYYKDVQKLKIAAVGDYSFLGEELLLGGDDSKYSYTITVSSIQARYYSIKKSILVMKFPNIIKDILTEYELKEAHRKQTVEYILSKDSQPTNMIQVDDTLHEFNKLKNCELFSQMKNAMVESHNKKIFKDVVAKEKEQTPENLAQFRSNVMKQIEEKQEPLKQVNNQYVNYDLEGFNTSSTPVFSNKQRRPLTSSAYLGGSRSPQIKLENSKNNIFTKDQLIEKLGFSNTSQPSAQSQSEKQQIIQQTLQISNQKGNSNNPVGDQQQQQQQSQLQLSSLSQLSSQPQNIQAQQAGTLSSRVGSAVPQSKQKNISATEGNETKQGNINNQLACDPVYSKLYQQQHDLESNFMENLTEKLKLMSKVPTPAPGEGPQLDLGYLEMFQKKQQLKLMVSAKAKLHQSGQNNNRSALVQKTVDKIKGKYAKDNSAEMENAFSDNPPLQISNQNLLAKTKLSLNTLVSSNSKTEISDLQFPVSLISPSNKGGYLLKQNQSYNFKTPYTPPLSGKHRYSSKNHGQTLQMYNQQIAAFAVPMSPRWKTLMSQQQYSPSNQQQQQQSKQQLDPNNLQFLTVHPLATSFTHMSSPALSQPTKNWSTFLNNPASNNSGFLTLNPVSPGNKKTHISLEMSDTHFNSSPSQLIQSKITTQNEELINIQDDKNCVKLPLKNSIQSEQTLQTQPRSNTIQSFENFTVISQPRRLVSAGPLSSMLSQAKNRTIITPTNNNSHNIAGDGGQIISAGVFSTDFDSLAGNLQTRPFSSPKGQQLQSNEFRQRCQTANSLQRKSIERKKLKTGLAFPRKTPLF